MKSITSLDEAYDWESIPGWHLLTQLEAVERSFAKRRLFERLDSESAIFSFLAPHIPVST